MLTPLQGYKTYIAAMLAIVGAMLSALDGDLTWPQAFDLIVPAVLGMTIRHGVSTQALSIMASLASAVVKAASDGTKASTILACIVFAMTLSACSTAQLQQAQQTVATVSQEVLSTADAACAYAGPLATGASMIPNATVTNLAAYVIGTCDLATGKVAVAAIPNVDANTGAWLGAIAGAIRVLAPPSPSASPAAPQPPPADTGSPAS